MNILLLLLLLLLITLIYPFILEAHETQRKPYIVYMGHVSDTTAGASLVPQHHNLLSKAIGDEEMARDVRIHSYGRSFNGFVAKLLPHEAQKLSEEDNVVSVFENTINKLHTTRSWDFLGLTESLLIRKPNKESNLVVGLLDTGIYMKSPSFIDKGYGPVPSSWKGKCITSANFTRCNKKVIGARYYRLSGGSLINEEPSPVDNDGHGTHTSSTAAGGVVKGASMYGVGKGNARGGVPLARIAMYKVCWYDGCTDMDMLAAFDDAIADGVDMLSVSIGGPTRKYFNDPMAIGAFHAMKKGILTSCSGGNEGPSYYTVVNVAPWIFTVGASTIDRQFRTQIKLGNGFKTYGLSINTYSPKKKMYPLTSGAVASNITGDSYRNASACDSGSLGKEKVKGKIVYCLGRGGQDHTIKKLNGGGVIMVLDEPTDIAFTTLIPGTFLMPKYGDKIDKYINATKHPQAVISKTTSVNTAAPSVVSFSSRGPQLLSPNILKPDISAPGLDILAAYSKLTSVSGYEDDDRHSAFNIISGTSMACPHVAAAAAYVKSFHPDWSPAAIKSAIMTTATPMKVKEESAELGSGSGQINPLEAVHPGLIYDISVTSYIQYLCKEGYNSTTIKLLIGGSKKYECSDFKPAKGSDGLNYPSMHTQIKNSTTKFSAVFYRTVTNVGYGKSVYKAKVMSPKGLLVEVWPPSLKFTKLHQKLSFKVVVKGSKMKKGTSILSALLEWRDSKHSVKSPIVVCNSLGYV